MRRLGALEIGQGQLNKDWQQLDEGIKETMKGIEEERRKGVEGRNS